MTVQIPQTSLVDEKLFPYARHVVEHVSGERNTNIRLRGLVGQSDEASISYLDTARAAALLAVDSSLKGNSPDHLQDLARICLLHDRAALNTSIQRVRYTAQDNYADPTTHTHPSKVRSKRHGGNFTCVRKAAKKYINRATTSISELATDLPGSHDVFDQYEPAHIGTYVDSAWDLSGVPQSSDQTNQQPPIVHRAAAAIATAYNLAGTEQNYRGDPQHLQAIRESLPQR